MNKKEKIGKEKNKEPIKKNKKILIAFATLGTIAVTTAVVVPVVVLGNKNGGEQVISAPTTKPVSKTTKPNNVVEKSAKKSAKVTLSPLSDVEGTIQGSNNVYTLSYIAHKDSAKKTSLETELAGMVAKATDDTTKVDFNGEWNSEFDGATNGAYVYTIKAQGYSDISFTINVHDMTWDELPQEIKDLYVAEGINGDAPEIPRGAFENGNLPKGFAIPSSITSIGEGAFSGATLPPELTIPSSVKSIGSWAFSLTNIPNSFILHSSVESIGSHAFEKTILPADFTIPKGNEDIFKLAIGVDKNGHFKNFLRKEDRTATSVKNGAFQDAKLPIGFKIPSSVTSIESYAFKNATLPEGFNLPESVTTIDDNAFEGATLPNSFTIPSSVTLTGSIGEDAFKATTISDSFAIPNGQENKFKWAMVVDKNGNFQNFLRKEDKNATTIRSDAFSGAKLPSGFFIPISVTSIGKNAFGGAIFTGYFEIPGNVTSIEEDAFKGAILPEGFAWSGLGQNGHQKAGSKIIQ